ncbi:hypothetical protein P8935_12380 [Telmatobacter sp. DSM 110680]|uniref:FecR family protein n=1 Tax=Telmatobacter sp. DSM 110680 TaxID=3036704 RepID=A0AAU7DDF8_9BACT
MVRILALAAAWMVPQLFAQSVPVQPAAPVEAQPAPAQPAPSNTPLHTPQAAPLAASQNTTSYGPTQSGPLAIVPLDSKDPSSAAMVTGALQVANGRAMIATNGAITSGTNTTEVTLPRRGVLRVCAATTVKLAADASVPQGEVPGLMMVIDHGAIEASFATGRNSDVLLTPDFRILIGAPGAADVKVRLGQHGDTCVDNAGTNAPYVLVTSVFDGGIYRVQPGQRVMFQHGSVYSVVDQEKEACGCPAPVHPNSNEFPEAQSAGLAPLAPPGPPGAVPAGTPTEATDTFVHKSGEPPPDTDTITSTKRTPNPHVEVATKKPPKVKGDKKPGFMTRMGHFFRRLFGAE